MLIRKICGYDEDESIPNDDSPYCKDIVKDWPYYLSKIQAEERTLVRLLFNLLFKYNILIFWKKGYWNTKES